MAGKLVTGRPLQRRRGCSVRLRKGRLEAGISAKKAVALLELWGGPRASPKTLERWENGSRNPPPDCALKLLAIYAKVKRLGT